MAGKKILEGRQEGPLSDEEKARLDAETKRMQEARKKREAVLQIEEASKKQQEKLEAEEKAQKNTEAKRAKDSKLWLTEEAANADTNNLINPRYTAKDIGDSETAERVMGLGGKRLPGSGRWKVVAGIGAAAGLIKTANDDTDDNLLSTAGKMAGGAGIALGADWGISKLRNKFTASDITKGDVTGETAHNLIGNSNSPEGKGNLLTTSNVEQELLKVKHDLSMEELQRAKKIKGWASKGKLAGLVGLGVFAVASAMDVGQDMADKTDTSKMVNEQERRLTKKQNQEKRNQAQNAYGHVDMGQMVLDMFDDRIGHHLMGNAKAQMPTYNTTYQG